MVQRSVTVHHRPCVIEMRSVLSIIVHLLLLARGCPSLNTSGGKVEEVEEDMEVPLSVVGGIACPYSATW